MCKDDIQPECLRMFDDIRNTLKNISTAVMGNGKPQGALVDRVARLEEAKEQSERGTDRTLKIILVCVGVVALISSIVTLVK